MPQWVLENAQEGSEYFEIHLALQLPAPSFLTEDVVSRVGGPGAYVSVPPPPELTAALRHMQGLAWALS